MARTQTLRTRLSEAHKRILQIIAREDRLIHAIYEMRIALDHAEAIESVKFSKAICKRAVEEYKKAGGIR
jgi:hypothetical protein